mgnify:CR=1 FL=1|jgi:hypothetical protein
MYFSFSNTYSIIDFNTFNRKLVFVVFMYLFTTNNILIFKNKLNLNANRRSVSYVKDSTLKIININTYSLKLWIVKQT